MSELLAGIRFVSKSDIDEKKRLAREAQERREAAEREAAKERRRSAQAQVASGEAQWVAPALERRVGHGRHASVDDDADDGHRRKKKHKHKKHKHKKHHRTHAEGGAVSSEGSASSGDDDRGRAKAGAGGAAIDGNVGGGDAAGREGAAHAAPTADRSAAGLDWMMRPPSKAGMTFAAPPGPSVAAGTTDDSAAAADPAPTTRVARELNPYARDGVDSSQWSAKGAGLEDAPQAAAIRPTGTDGGQSWQAKKLRRAVEEAESSGRTLEAVCLERFGDLEQLAQMQSIASGGGRSGAAFDAHLRAGNARAIDAPPRRRQADWDGAGAGEGAERSSRRGGRDSRGGPLGGDGGRGGRGGGRCSSDGKGSGAEGGAMKRPRLGGSLTWSAASRGDGSSGVGEAGGSTAASASNHFTNDGSFMASLERRNFLYGGRSADRVDEEPASQAEAEADLATDEVAAKAEGTPLVPSIDERQAEETKRAVPPGAGGTLDLNKLAAKAMKAKLIGNVAEHDRLQGIIDAAKADGSAMPPPPPAPPGSLATDSAARDKTVQVGLPADAVGAIIGKGGATIDALQRESGAKLRLPSGQSESEGASGSGQRVLLISGSEEAIGLAQQLIEEKLNQRAEAGAQRGGKALKNEVRGNQRRGAGQQPVYDEVPTFDKATGGLVVQRVKVGRSREEEDAQMLRQLNSEPTPLSEKQPKRVQRYGADGERSSFFRDEQGDGQSLNELVVAERRGGLAGGAGRIDANMADAISRSKRYKGPNNADDEYDYDDGVEMSDARSAKQSEAKRQRQAKAAAGMERKQQATASERAEARFSRHKALVVAVGQHTYLRLQDVSPLAPGHCVIEPLQAVSCLTEAAEEVADEVRNFQKCLIRMHEADGRECIFLEQHTAPARLLAGAAAGGLGGLAGLVGGGGRTMAVECVPLSARDGRAAPAYFRKAILESGEEWSQHRKLHEMPRGSVRGVVPPGFSYFACSFGVGSGYATVIEDEAEWPHDFGRDVLEGILEHPDAGIPLARRKREPFDAMQRRVVAATKAFEPHDWTKML